MCGTERTTIPSCFSVRYRVCENTSIGLLVAVAEGIVSNTLPTYFFRVNFRRKRVPCCWDVERIFSFLNVANTPLEIRTTLLPSMQSGSSASESLRRRLTSTNKLLLALLVSMELLPTSMTEGNGFNIR